MFNNNLKHLIKLIGLKPTDFSSHSFRRGGATIAFQAHVEPELIKYHGDWKSDAYLVYLEYNFAQKLSVSQRMAFSIWFPISVSYFNLGSYQNILIVYLHWAFLYHVTRALDLACQHYTNHAQLFLLYISTGRYSISQGYKILLGSHISHLLIYPIHKICFYKLYIVHILSFQYFCASALFFSN